MANRKAPTAPPPGATKPDPPPAPPTACFKCVEVRFERWFQGRPGVFHVEYEGDKDDLAF